MSSTVTAIDFENKPAEVLLVGFGAVGIIYAYLLESKKLARVTCLARAKKYIRLQERGIDIHSKKWGVITGWRPHRVVQSLEEVLDSSFDYCIVSTKAVPEVLTTPALLGPLLTDRYHHPQPAYVLLQNGLGVEADLYSALKGRYDEPTVISCALYIMTNVTAEGNVSHGTFERILVGIYKEGPSIPDSPAQEQAMHTLVKLVTKSGSEASVTPNIAADKFRKNLWNASVGMISSLLGLSPSECACDENALDTAMAIVHEMMTELMVVARAIGYDESLIPSNTPDSIVMETRTKLRGTDFVPSALLDVRLGIPFELEVILGYPLREAQARQLSTPRLEFVYRMLSVIQARLLKQSVQQ